MKKRKHIDPAIAPEAAMQEGLQLKKLLHLAHEAGLNLEDFLRRIVETETLPAGLRREAGHALAGLQSGNAADKSRKSA